MEIEPQSAVASIAILEDQLVPPLLAGEETIVGIGVAINYLGREGVYRQLMSQPSTVW